MNPFTILLILFVAIVAYPVFAYTPPTPQEQSLYEGMREQFERLTVPTRHIGDALRSLDEPVTVSFACNTGDFNRRVQATVTTRLANFDTSLTHSGGAVTGGIYAWKCSITYSSGQLTINCQNELMFNHDAIKSTAEKDPRIRHMEEIIVFYHEMLHGQLMMDAMRSQEWQTNACNKRPQQPVDFSHTDADHHVIMPLQTELAERLITQNGGTMRIETIEPHEAPSGEFSKKAGSLNDYPDYRRGGVNISARSYNLNDLQITTQDTDILLSGTLANKTEQAIVWMYVFARGQDATAAQPVPAPQPTAQPPAEIPQWVKNNAGWWVEGTAEDRDFMAGIKYLVQNKMISYQAAPSGHDFVPSWVKNNARWWVSDMIRDSEFVLGMEYLLKSGIMGIKAAEEPKAARQESAPVQQETFVQVSKDSVEKNRYQSSMIHVTGKVENYRAGTSVTLEITRPNGSVFEMQGLVTSKGLFTVPLLVDGNYQSGRYDIRAVYNNYELGTTSFTVN